ncbi:Ran-specific GTPase-activating protein 30 [Mycoemilia scoparia]|uniref:Ran-specific GTPase-activating protein 30 n=1 Tax=Mycoemilia scoparia TaxID=417184 RepID=A0A9W8DV78_9FUNG|nr:Ran-specific GTPase-activating protein 30 [Mycoemilia scoparia]
MSRVPQNKEQYAELERLRERFETKLRVVTPAIDLIEIITARGHSTMASVLNLTHSIRNDINTFRSHLEALEQHYFNLEQNNKHGSSRNRKSGFFSLPTFGGGSNADGSESLSCESNLPTVSSIAEELRTLLQTIDDAVPLLNLALNTSGVNFGGGIPAGVSPSRLMQASSLLINADVRFNMSLNNAVEKDSKVLERKISNIRVGDALQVRLYSLFTGSIRAKSLADFTWKEEYYRSNVYLERIDSGDCFEKPFAYQLVIAENLNDGRYHEQLEDHQDSDMEDFIPGQNLVIDLPQVHRLYYTSSGSLLNIEDSQSPVLVIKVGPPEESQSQDVFSTPSRDAENESNFSWYALEVYEDEYDDEESQQSEDSDNTSTNSDESKPEGPVESRESTPSSSPSSFTPATSPAGVTIAPEDDQKSPVTDSSQILDMTSLRVPLQDYERHIALESLREEWVLSMLSILEYLLRLAAVEVCEQRSHLQIPDEKLNLYLRDDSETNVSQANGQMVSMSQSRSSNSRFGTPGMSTPLAFSPTVKYMDQSRTPRHEYRPDLTSPLRSAPRLRSTLTSLSPLISSPKKPSGPRKSHSSSN